MKYAVVAISGTQYQAQDGQTLTIDKIDTKEGETFTTDQALLTVDGDQVTVGTPTVAGVAVEFKVVKHYQGTKTKVFKYKSKSRYRRSYGFRAQLTDIQVTNLGFGTESKKDATPAVKPVKKAVAKKSVKTIKPIKKEKVN